MIHSKKSRTRPDGGRGPLIGESAGCPVEGCLPGCLPPPQALAGPAAPGPWEASAPAAGNPDLGRRERRRRAERLRGRAPYGAFPPSCWLGGLIRRAPHGTGETGVGRSRAGGGAASAVRGRGGLPGLVGPGFLLRRVRPPSLPMAGEARLVLAGNPLGKFPIGGNPRGKFRAAEVRAGISRPALAGDFPHSVTFRRKACRGYRFGSQSRTRRPLAVALCRRRSDSAEPVPRAPKAGSENGASGIPALR